MMAMTIMKTKTKKLKTRVGMLKNMGGNIPGRNFLGGNFPGGSLMGGNFLIGSFPDTQKIKYEFHLLPYEKLIKKKPREVFCEIEISQNSQENTCARVSFLTYFSYRTPLVAASVNLFPEVC